MKAPRISWNFLRVAGVVVTTALGSAAIAPLAYGEQAATGLEEVMVTATRRETNLQTTPIAVSAISGDVISETIAHDIGDLAHFVPNFSASKITGFNAASFAMRGVGQNNIIVYFEAPVAVLRDDFVLPSVQTQLLDPFDVESVEVLRGPQGTLFGKNTTGGAVVVHSKRPVLKKFSAEFDGLYGDYGTAETKGMLNLPIGDTLALRLVAGYEKSDGYMRNGAPYGPLTPFYVLSKYAGVAGRGDCKAVGGNDVKDARLKLLWQPSDKLSALLQYEWLRDRSKPIAAVNETPVGDNTFLWNLLGIPAPGGDPIRVGSTSNRVLGNILNTKDGNRIDVDGIYLNIDWTVGSGTLTSVTGWRRQISRLNNTYVGAAPVAADGEILSLFDTNRADDRKTMQQEVRYASKLTGPVNYVAGVFAQYDKADFCADQVLGFLDLVSGPLPFGPWNQNPYVLCNGQTARSYAGFGELTYAASDKLTLTGGLRYTKEYKGFRARQQAFLQTLGGSFDLTLNKDTLGPLDGADFDRFPAGVIHIDKNWGNATWRLNAGYQFQPDFYGYASYSRGFKSGGFNDQAGGFAPYGADLNAFVQGAQPTNPETADYFEAGIKTQALENRLRLNLTAFYVQYKDLQKQIVVPITVNGQPNQVTTFFNAAKSEVKGLEVELLALPTPALTLRGVLGLQDGKYKSYVTPIPAGYNLASAPLDRTPKTTWSLDATYRIDAGKLAWSFNAGTNYVSENLFTQSISTPTQNSFLDARTLLNASITVSNSTNKYFVRLAGRNLGDTRYRTASQVVGGLWTFTTYGESRFYGVELGAKF